MDLAKIVKKIDDLSDDSLEFLHQLVRTPSLERDEKNCQLLVKKKFESLDLDTDMFDLPEEEIKKHPAYVPTKFSYKDRPNVCGTLRGKGNGKSLMYLGHIDVVPTGPEETWDLSPWSGEYIDGKLYWRGSCDMKAGLVSMILAIEAIIECGYKLKGDVYLNSIIDEEVGGNGTLGCLLKGYKADACIQPEPTGLKKIAISGRGAQFFKIIVQGQSGGTEYKHSLVNPISKALEVFNAVEQFSLIRESEAKHELYEEYFTKVPTGICKFHSGEWPSTVPEQAIMEGTLECLPGEDIHTINRRFVEYLQELGAKDPWFKDHPINVVYDGLWFESAEIDRNDPIVSNIVKSSKKMIIDTPQIMGGGGSDLRLPILYANTPTVLFGHSGGPIHR